MLYKLMLTLQILFKFILVSIGIHNKQEYYFLLVYNEEKQTQFIIPVKACFQPNRPI